MPIIKTLTKATKLEKEKFTIPKSVQDAIPIQRIWPDGIFQVGSRFSKTFSFTDINYSIASKDDKTAMFLDYSELLNVRSPRQNHHPQPADRQGAGREIPAAPHAGGWPGPFPQGVQ